MSDSLSCCGCKSGVYFLGGQEVVLDGTLARLKDGTIAGSANHLFGIMRIAVSMGIPMDAAVRMASYNPAKVLGVENEVGSIAPGPPGGLPGVYPRSPTAKGLYGRRTPGSVKNENFSEPGAARQHRAVCQKTSESGKQASQSFAAAAAK